MSDDADLEALFDEISAQTLPAATAGAAPAAPAATGTPVDAAPEDPAGKPLYDRLGGIVRLLHDSMRELGYDRSLTDVATQMGDAQNRLEHVATLTADAANKVLNALDTSMPAQDRLQAQARELNERWGKLYTGQMNIEQFKQLAGDSRNFSATVVDSTEAEKARMLEIMMAQDFQDITGQLIKKILAITSVAESELAQLLRDYAPPEVRAQIEADKPASLLNGPAAPGTALAQNDVDDLLDSLGF